MVPQKLSGKHRLDRQRFVILADEKPLFQSVPEASMRIGPRKEKFVRLDSDHNLIWNLLSQSEVQATPQECLAETETSPILVRSPTAIAPNNSTLPTLRAENLTETQDGQDVSLLSPSSLSENARSSLSPGSGMLLPRDR